MRAYVLMDEMYESPMRFKMKIKKPAEDECVHCIAHCAISNFENFSSIITISDDPSWKKGL